MLRTGGLTCILDRKKLKPDQFVAWNMKLAQHSQTSTGAPSA